MMQIKNKVKIMFNSSLGKILGTIGTCIVGTLLTLVLTNYYNRESIGISVRYNCLNTYPPQHIYVVEITNKGKSTLTDIKLKSTLYGHVHASTFEDRVTTHTPLELKPIYDDFTGEVAVDKTDKFTSIDINYRHDINNHKGSSGSEKKITSVKDGPKTATVRYVYNVSLESFALKPKETKYGTLNLDHEIATMDIRCETENDIFSPKKIETMPSIYFQKVMASTSIAKGIKSNKLFVEGMGISKNGNETQSHIEARYNALADLYKDIAQKIYGVKIESTSSLIDEYQNKEDEEKYAFDFSNKTIIKTEGVIDKQRLVIYDEAFEELSDYSIKCRMKAYYKIPWQISPGKTSGIQDTINYSSFQPTPIELTLNKKKPQWVVDGGASIEGVVTAVGSASYGIDKTIAKQIARMRAIDEITRKMNIKVSNLTTSFHDEGSSERYRREVNKQIAEQSLQNIITKEIFYDENEVYVLCQLKNNFIKNSIIDVIRDGESLWQKFQSKKAYEELNKEIERIFSK